MQISQQIQQKAISIPKKGTPLGELLKSFAFSASDTAFLQAYSPHHIGYEKACEKYELLKAAAIGEYFKGKYEWNIQFDMDQLNALASIRKNTLVTARAGSWKTQVIAGKIAFELQNGLSAKNVLALSFNTKAAGEMLTRVQSRQDGFGMKQFGNAFTFHSLAYRLLKPSEEILLDMIKYENPTTGEEIIAYTLRQQMYVRDIFWECYDTISPLMQKSFSKELGEFKKYGTLDSDEDYIYKRRGQQFYSYTSHHTKSKGEKFLLDLLYEYGFVDIRYEPPQALPKGFREYDLKRADASCRHPQLRQKIVFEHWWVDEDSGHTPEHWSMTKEQYIENRNQKKKYYLELEKKGKCIFIETNIRDMEWPHEPRQNFYKNVRRRIEEKLQEKLGGDFVLKKISKETFLAWLRKNDRKIPSFINKVLTYINFCQLQDRDPANARSLIPLISDKKIQDFHTICSIIYERYEQKKGEDWLLDFNTLLRKAAELIENDSAVTRRRIENNSDMPGFFSIWELSLVCIDEYQDFSTLFYRLLKAMEKKNPNFRLFVVGDDWQAINQFAWSDVRYFMEFNKLYAHTPTVRKQLSNNYRSIASIVESGNLLMKWYGDPAISAVQDDSGIIPEIILDTNTKTPEFKKYELLIEKALPASENVCFETQNKRKIALWTIVRAIADMEKLWTPGAKTLAISRNNRVYWMKHTEWIRSIKLFQSELISHGHKTDAKQEFKSFLVNERFVIMTAHKSKGKQAESVILLDVSEKSFPSEVNSLRHDSEYFSVFDDTPENQLENSRRLFYVAITRSKKYLKILADGEDRSKLIDWILLYSEGSN